MVHIEAKEAFSKMIQVPGENVHGAMYSAKMLKNLDLRFFFPLS